MTKDCLEKNLKTLQRHHPRIFAIVAAYYAKASHTESHLPDYQSIQSALEASRELSVFRYPKIVILNGMGWGCSLVDFFKNPPPSVRHVLVVEHSVADFVEGLKTQDLSTVLSRPQLEFCLGLPVADMPKFVLEYFMSHEDRLLCSDRIENSFFKPALEQDGAYYRAFSEAVSGVVAEMTRHGVFAPGEDNWRGLLNILNNRKSLEKFPSLESFRDFFSGQTAVLLGAGPSLAQEFNHLKKHREKLFIMACDAAVIPLAKAGIDPDFIVCAERVGQIAHLFQGMSSTSQSVLFTLPSVHPRVLKALQRPVVFVKRHATFGSWIWPNLNMPDVPIGVTSMGFAILKMLGFRDVYMLGQNLSLDPDERQTHVSGAVDFLLSSAAAQTEYDVVTTTSYLGGELKTLRMWHSFIREFSDQIHAHPEGSCFHVIDPAKGARIEGAVHLEPSDFWLRVQDFSQTCQKKSAFAERLQLSCGKDISSTIEATTEYCQTLRFRLLDFMHCLSADHIKLLNESEDHQIWGQLESTLARWRDWQNLISDREHPLYVSFFCCLFSNLHVQLMSRREAKIPERDNVHEYLDGYVALTLEWAVLCLGWVDRCLDIFGVPQPHTEHDFGVLQRECLAFMRELITDYHDHLDFLNVDELYAILPLRQATWQARAKQILSICPEAPWGVEPDWPEPKRATADKIVMYEVFANIMRFLKVAGWADWQQEKSLPETCLASGGLHG